MAGRNVPSPGESSSAGQGDATPSARALGTVEGRIFDIQRACTHDGPGIRTTVFLKGCFLRCAWCHNPESIDPRPQIMFREQRCIGCLACFEACEHGALRLVDEGGHGLDARALHPGADGLRDGLQREYQAARCVRCGACVDACYPEALEMVGRAVTVAKVCREVSRDRAFFDNSGGGVTLSGGEPLFQSRFAHGLLRACHETGLHTALDTTAYGPWERLAALLPHVDLVLLDLKCMNDDVHRRYTGVSNSTILANARRLALEMTSRPIPPGEGRQRFGVWVRVPVIPGVNDDDANIAGTAQFVRDEMGEEVRAFELLAYHRLGQSKTEALGQGYALTGLDAPSREHMTRLASLVRDVLARADVEVRWR